MNKTTSNSYAGTSGGLSLPGFYNLDASVDRPSVSKAVVHDADAISSVFSQLAVDYGGFLFADFSLRNDVSSTLPEKNNSYNYYWIFKLFSLSIRISIYSFCIMDANER